MKKLIVVCLVLIMSISMFTACNGYDNAVPDDAKSPKSTTATETIKPTEMQPTETVDGTEPVDYLNYEYFEATGILYDRADYIGSFPFFAGTEDFWDSLNYMVTNDNSVIGTSNTSSWNEVKDLLVSDVVNLIELICLSNTIAVSALSSKPISIFLIL